MMVHIQQGDEKSAPVMARSTVGGAVRYVRPVSRREAGELVATVYDQIAEEFALVPPMTLHSPVPEILAGVWCVAREAFVVNHAGRARRETVAAAISRTNDCPYCVEVHTGMLHAAAEHRLAAGLLTVEGARAAAEDNPLVAWGLATRSPGVAILANPPFAPDEAPQILGTAVIFHFINRMVNIYLDETPMPVKMRGTTLRSMAGRLFGATLGRKIFHIEAAPGRSLSLLPDAPLPEEFGWARSNPAVAGALARMAHAIESEGTASLPPSAIRIVRDHLDGWNGEDPGLDARWLDDAIAPLAGETERAAAQLALLAALTSYRVDAHIVRAFRRHFPTPQHLIAATAWGSFEAARRISTWLSSSENERIRKGMVT